MLRGQSFIYLVVFSIVQRSSRLGGNLAGQYKRAAAVGLQIGFANAAGAAVSNIYRAQDAPGYKLGRKLYDIFAT